MQRQNLQGTGCKLDFHHREQGPAAAVHDVVGQGVVEHGGVVATELDLTARCALMEAIAHERQQGMVVWEGLEQIVLALADARHGGGKNKRMQWRGFELVADGTINGLGFQKMVGVNGLWRAVPGLDLLLEHPRRHHHRMQKGSFPQAAMRIRRARTQQHGRGVDGPTCQHIMFCYYFNSVSPRYLLPQGII